MLFDGALWGMWIISLIPQAYIAVSYARSVNAGRCNQVMVGVALVSVHW